MPIIIKRYKNRKLYNTRSKRYITLDEIQELIKQQEDIQVLENETGNDITATTLSQIIFGLEKNHTGVLPTNLLFSLVQSGGKRIDDIRKNLFYSLNFEHHYNAEIDRRINLLIEAGEFNKAEGTLLREKLVSISYKPENILESVEGRIIEFIKDQQIPSRDDIQSLMNEIDALSQLVDNLNTNVEQPGTEKTT